MFENEDEDDAIRLLKSWCLLAPLKTYKREHDLYKPRDLSVLPDCVLEAELEKLPAPPVPIVSDLEMDAGAPLGPKRRAR